MKTAARVAEACSFLENCKKVLNHSTLMYIVNGLSALFPHLNWGFASALCSRMLAHCEELGLVNFPRHVCPGDQTGPISMSSSVARLGPMVQA